MEESLTAVRVNTAVVVLTSRAISDLTLGLDVRRNAGLDAGPLGLTLAVARKQLRRLKYRGEVIDELARGSVVVRRALFSGICDIGRRFMKGEQGETIGERRRAPVILAWDSSELWPWARADTPTNATRSLRARKLSIAKGLGRNSSKFLLWA